MKANITQEFVAGLQPGKPTTIRDTKLSGFMVVVNSKSISFAVQRDLWQNRRLVKTCRVILGRTATMTVKDARLKAARAIDLIASGVDPNQKERPEATLSDAFADYLDMLVKRDRSPKTIAGYKYDFAAYLAPLHKKTLAQIDPVTVRKLHSDITRKRGPYSANRSMALLRAVYRHARRVDDRLPEDPVGRAVVFNREKRRNYGMDAKQVAAWWTATNGISNPVRRAFHRTCLLTGARPGSVAALRWRDVDFDAGVMRFEQAKGHPYSVPLNSLVRDVLGNLPRISDEWLFPSDSRAGHVVEWKEHDFLTGHALRHVYRGILAQVGVDGLTGRLLMGHTVSRDVHDGYLDATVIAAGLARASEKVADWIRAAAGITDRSRSVARLVG
jgi:integrase